MLNTDERKKKDLNRWKHILFLVFIYGFYLFCSWTGRLNILKMSILPKLITSFNVITMKSQFIDIEKFTYNSYGKAKE